MKFLFQQLGGYVAYLVLLLWCAYDFLANSHFWDAIDKILGGEI